MTTNLKAVEMLRRHAQEARDAGMEKLAASYEAQAEQEEGTLSIPASRLTYNGEERTFSADMSDLNMAPVPSWSQP